MMRKLLLTGLSFFVLSACSKPNDNSYSGYVEFDTVVVAAPQAGWITGVFVDRGAAITPNQPLFTLDPTTAQNSLQGAQSRMEAATATATDLTKGAREADIAPYLAQRQKAVSDLELARANQARYEALEPKGFVSATRMDQLRAATKSAEAALSQIDKTIADLKQAARDDQLKAATATASAAQADVANAAYALTERTVVARTIGQVEERLREPGEYVAAGSPIITLYAKDRQFVRFYVPQSKLSAIKVGQEVSIGCDGCATGLKAKVRYISPTAEFTPPVIYSVRERQKMLFLIEAVPERAGALPAGLPVDVSL